MQRSQAAKDIRSSSRQRWHQVREEVESGTLIQRVSQTDSDIASALLQENGGAPEPSYRRGDSFFRVVRAATDGVGTPLRLSQAGDGTQSLPASFFERNFAVGSGAGLQARSEFSVDEPNGKVLNCWWSPRSDATAIWNLLMSSWVNLMLLLVPLGVLAHHLKWGPVPVFLLNFGGIIPLALVLGDVTEDLALRCGEIVGGLVNATFGNIVELIISLVALSKKTDAMNQVAGMSNLGSILSNLLLVLGCCFLFGGMKHKIQKFNALANQVCNSLLFLAVIALVLPVTAAHLPEIHFSKAQLLFFSRVTSIVLFLAYLAYLYFQLVSHHNLFSGEEDGDEKPALTITAELGVLLALSLVVSVASERITSSIEDMSKSSGLSTSFLSIILLPIAGNAVEHITAVMVAVRNKMDLALGIAIGSSIQIAIFVIPSCVLVSWAIENPFSLEFNALGTMSMVLAVIHANFITGGATSHWLMGVQLISTYLLIAAAFLFI